MNKILWVLFGNDEDTVFGPSWFMPHAPLWKKRIFWWIRNPSAKMTEDQVIKIRIDGRTANEIARSFGISIKQVANIKSGFSWRYLI